MLRENYWAVAFIVGSLISFSLCDSSHAKPLGKVIENFEYTPPDDPPTNHGWVVIAGTGTVSTISDSSRLFHGYGNNQDMKEYNSLRYYTKWQYCKKWRRDWDLNPGGPFGAYTLSRRAP